MSTPKLVEDFYERIWKGGNLDATAELLTPEFSFRGSLGNEMRGRDAFKPAYAQNWRSDWWL